VLPGFWVAENTLSNHLYASCEERKFAVIERGFSGVNIDAALRASTGVNLRIMPASLWEANGMAPCVEIVLKGIDIDHEATLRAVQDARLSDAEAAARIPSYPPISSR